MRNSKTAFDRNRGDWPQINADETQNNAAAQSAQSHQQLLPMGGRGNVQLSTFQLDGWLGGFSILDFRLVDLAALGKLVETTRNVAIGRIQLDDLLVETQCALDLTSRLEG